jgi:hypothetical protein
MLYQKVLRGAVITFAVAGMFLATPAESRDCLSWLFGGCGARTTYRAPYYAPSYAPSYAPVYSAPACTSCVPQTVRYVPQTYYRTVYRSVPVTTYGAFTRSDPCTGCPVTYYRPVTSWTYQAAYVPYTTYRLVYSNPCSPCVTTSSCSSCISSVGTTSAVGGACCTPSAGGAAGTGTLQYSESFNSTNGQPSQGTPAPETFKQGESESATEPITPVPDPKTSSAPGPDLTDPGGRTTHRPVRQAVHFRLITSPSKPTTADRPRLDDGGWRAARD